MIPGDGGGGGGDGGGLGGGGGGGGWDYPFVAKSSVKLSINWPETIVPKKEQKSRGYYFVGPLIFHILLHKLDV